MPSIEIYGFSSPDSQALKERIEGLLLGTPFEGMDIKVPSIITDTEHPQKPFIRLLSSKPQEAEEVLRILKKVLSYMEIPYTKIEYVKIPSFAPRG